MNENISNQDNINEDEVKAYIKTHREELDLDNPNKQIDFFEELKHKLQNFNFEDEFDYKLLRESITGNIRKTFNRLMPYYQREDFEKKTETFNQLLKTYRVFKIVSRFCDENKLNGYVSSDIKFPIEFETEYNRLFTDDNKIVLSQNPTQDVRPEVSKSEDIKRTDLAMEFQTFNYDKEGIYIFINSLQQSDKVLYLKWLFNEVCRDKSAVGNFSEKIRNINTDHLFEMHNKFIGKIRSYIPEEYRLYLLETFDWFYKEILNDFTSGNKEFGRFQHFIEKQILIPDSSVRRIFLRDIESYLKWTGCNDDDPYKPLWNYISSHKEMAKIFIENTDDTINHKVDWEYYSFFSEYVETLLKIILIPLIDLNDENMVFEYDYNYLLNSYYLDSFSSFFSEVEIPFLDDRIDFFKIELDYEETKLTIVKLASDDIEKHLPEKTSESEPIPATQPETQSETPTLQHPQWNPNGDFSKIIIEKKEIKPTNDQQEFLKYCRDHLVEENSFCTDELKKDVVILNNHAGFYNLWHDSHPNGDILRNNLFVKVKKNVWKCSNKWKHYKNK